MGLSAIALWANPDGKPKSFRDAVQVIFSSTESIAIAAAVALYFKEIPDRKEQKHYEAWQVIDNAAAAKVPTSYARRKAIEDLHRDGVSLRGIDIPNVDLQGINLSFANLVFTNLNGANLSGAEWDESTKWPVPEEIAKASGVPQALKQQLGDNYR